MKSLQLLSEKEPGSGLLCNCSDNRYHGVSMAPGLTVHWRIDLHRLEQAIKEHHQGSDLQLLKSLLVFLETQSWMARDETDSSEPDSSETKQSSFMEILQAVEYLISLFHAPLEAKCVCITSIQDELEDIVEYSKKDLAIEVIGLSSGIVQTLIGGLMVII